MAATGHITISVVIPVYNGVNTICRAVDSALAQSYAPHELIVIDDASTDSTVAMLKRQYNGRIKLIELSANEGSSAARNAGMDVAHGSYIAFLDADDIWHKDKLRVAASILQQVPDIALLYHHYTLQNIAGTPIPLNMQAIPLPFARLLPGNIISTSTAVVKNNSSFRFAPHMRYTEDYDLWLRIGYAHKVVCIPYELTQLFRPVTSSGGISSRTWQMRRGELRAYSRLARLNLLFIFIIPFLWLFSLLKHILKATGIIKASSPQNASFNQDV